MKSPIVILHVDDEKSASIVLKKQLERVPGLQFEFFTADTSATALVELSRRKFDAIFLDFQLRTETALEVLPLIQTTSFSGPVIVLSAHEDDKTVTDMTRAGVHGYIAKRDLNPTALRLALTFGIEQAEHERTNRRLASLVEQTDVGIIDWDSDFTIKEWNPAAARIFGYSREEMLGQSAQRIVPSEAWAAVQSLWSGLANNGSTVVESTADNLREDGRRICCHWTFTAVRDRNGNLDHVISLVRDISKTRALEKQLRESEKRQAIAELGAGAAHHFNNIALGILSMAELLQARIGDNPQANTYLQTILTSAQRAADIAGRLFALGQPCTNIHVHPARRLFTDICNELATRLPQNTTLQLELQEALGSVAVDASQFERAIRCLVANATSAMAPKGGGIVRVVAEAAAASELDPLPKHLRCRSSTRASA